MQEEAGIIRFCSAATGCASTCLEFSRLSVNNVCLSCLLSQCLRNDKMEHNQDKHRGLIQKDKEHEAPTDWKEIFKRMYIGNTHKRFTSYRGYCRQCKSIVWFNNLACSNPHIGSKSTSGNIKPISQQWLITYYVILLQTVIVTSMLVAKLLSVIMMIHLGSKSPGYGLTQNFLCDEVIDYPSI